MTVIAAMEAKKKKRSYYSKPLDKLERVELRNAAALDGIDDEIALIRFKIKQLVNLSKNKDEDITSFLNALCRALITRRAIGDTGTKQLKNAIRRVVQDVLIPLGVDIASAAIKKRL